MCPNFKDYLNSLSMSKIQRRLANLFRNRDLALIKFTFKVAACGATISYMAYASLAAVLPTTQ